MTESQIQALLTLAASSSGVDPSEAGLAPMTMAALRRRGWAEMTGKYQEHRGTRAGFLALAQTLRAEMEKS